MAYKIEEYPVKVSKKGKHYESPTKSAVEHGVMSKNQTKRSNSKIDKGLFKVELLSAEDIVALINTHYEGEVDNIRRAFILCLYCGMRFCDVKALTFANVDEYNHLLRYEVCKTKGQTLANYIVIPLSEDALSLIGQPNQAGNRDELIFKLPSHTMCLKTLRHWAERAGIEKYITWHSARHVFAANLLNKGETLRLCRLC